MTENSHRPFRRALLLAGASALALALGACSNALKEQAENEAKSDAGSAAALVRIGDATRAGGDTASAVGFYQRAGLVAPNDAATQLRLATALLEMGSYGESERAFQRVLEIDPANVEAQRGLGNIYIATDQAKAAAAQFERVIATKPSYQAYNGLGVALDLEGNHAAAQDTYRKGLTQNPSSLTLQNNLALSLSLAGNYAEAIEILRRVAQHPQATARHRQNLALVFGLSGDTERAAEVAKMDLEPKAVESNLAYYAWLRSQPKLAPADVMRFKGPNGAGGNDVPAIEEGERREKAGPADVNALASAELIPGVTAISSLTGRNAAIVAHAAAPAAAPRTQEPRATAARLPLLMEPSAADDEPGEIDGATDDDANDYVLLPEERAIRAVQVAVRQELSTGTPRRHFRTMSYGEFAQSVGILAPACHDDFKRSDIEMASRPAETPVPVQSRAAPVVAAAAAIARGEPITQVAYQVDSSITISGLRRY